ncbi:MAG: NADH:ubiquinone oxidoreductase [Pseudomonadota bacterium]
MPQLTLELLLLMLLAFLIGCILGCLFRTMFAADSSPAEQPAKTSTGDAKATVAAAARQPEPESGPEPVAASKTKPEPEPKPAASKTAAKVAAAPASKGKPVRPKGLPGARDGKPDKLQMISGVGPKLEKTLHGLGFFHFDQIAAWGKDQVDWVDEHLRYKGRIERDEWIAQAKLLAEDDMEQFNKLYGTGGSAKTKPQAKSTTKRPAKKKK